MAGLPSRERGLSPCPVRADEGLRWGGDGEDEDRWEEKLKGRLLVRSCIG